MDSNSKAKKALDIIYLMGAVEHFKNCCYKKKEYKKKRLSETMDKVFIEIYNFDRGQGEKIFDFISKRINIAPKTVKLYAHRWYKILGEIAQSKIDHTVFRSGIDSLLEEKLNLQGIQGFLDPRNLEYIQNNYPNIPPEEAVNHILDKIRIKS